MRRVQIRRARPHRYHHRLGTHKLRRALQRLEQQRLDIFASLLLPGNLSKELVCACCCLPLWWSLRLGGALSPVDDQTLTSSSFVANRHWRLCFHHGRGCAASGVGICKTTR